MTWLTRGAIKSVFKITKSFTHTNSYTARDKVHSRFSRASISASKQCIGSARNVEITALADVKRIPDDIQNVS